MKNTQNISLTSKINLNQCWIHFQRFGTIYNTIFAKSIVYIAANTVIQHISDMDDLEKHSNKYK